MSEDQGLEPFPNTFSARPAAPRRVSSKFAEGSTRRRRASSNLPGDPRGDTGGVSIDTYSDHPPQDAQHSPFFRTPSEKARPRSKRRKAKSLFRRWKSFSLRHTWFMPLVMLLIILGLYGLNPTESNPLHRAIFLSYPLARNDPLAIANYARQPDTVQYGKGGRDFAFVAFYIIVFSFTREFFMQRLLRPLAIKAGIKSRAKQSRFMEQAYTAIYFAVFSPFGLYVMYRSPVWFFKTSGMYEGFPHRSHEGLFKLYYLLQAAYWAQQAVVLLLQLEKPRKDFKELVGHHIITVALIWLSYRFHFAYMGVAVYITHDVSDFFLATSKVFNYLSWPIVGPYYGFFILVWAYCRHYLNLRILYSILTEFSTVGDYTLNWDTQQYKCWISQYITFALLASLQSINLFWFFLILRIGYRYVVLNVAKDDRSEDGTTDAEDAEVETTAEKRDRLGIKAEDKTAGISTGVAAGANGVAGQRKQPELKLMINDEPAIEGTVPGSPTGGQTIDAVQDRRRKKAR